MDKEEGKIIAYIVGFSILIMALCFGYCMVVTPHELKAYRPTINRALELGRTVEHSRVTAIRSMWKSNDIEIKLLYLEDTGQIDMEEFKEWNIKRKDFQ